MEMRDERGETWPVSPPPVSVPLGVPSSLCASPSRRRSSFSSVSSVSQHSGCVTVGSGESDGVNLDYGQISYRRECGTETMAHGGC